ncbi:hypothetical protein PR048_016751 [Dryococelus australis]|uniref:ATP-dependent DNA helicase n=1 Tax=Dryococelus australis TaxID=614101 RepID=A0ABQ9H7U0_9NEOP|nr:hypothetical protein PR048_016751 [Dryococelus australis]
MKCVPVAKVTLRGYFRGIKQDASDEVERDVVHHVPQDQTARGRARPRVYHSRHYRAAAKGSDVAVDARDMGCMKCECRHYDALFFADEGIKREGAFTMCCMRGKVHIPPLGDCPQLLHHLLTGDGDDCTDYRQLIRKYNADFSFASFCADSIVASPRHSVYTFQIHGQHNPCQLGILQDLEHLLSEINPLAQIHKSMHEVMVVEEEGACRNGRPLRRVTLTLKPGLGNDPNVYNLPAAVNEVAAIFVGDVPPMKNDLRIYPKDWPAQFISPLNVLAYHMMHPLLFPQDEHGYTSGVSHSVIVSESRNTVTCKQDYVFRILHHSGRLFQHSCGGIVDAAQSRVGKLVILPSSFYGSERQMYKCYQDSVAIMCHFGRPDLFINFTCNPKGLEIAMSLEVRQQASQRPQMVCQVFKVKLDSLIDDIHKKQIFDKVSAYTYTIAFQKWELPHAHILINLDKGDKIVMSDDVDEIVRADIPDRDAEPSSYFSSPEACWRLLLFKMEDRKIIVVQLSLHLENRQSVIIQDNDVAGALERACKKHTHLTAFFHHNSQHKLLHHRGTSGKVERSWALEITFHPHTLPLAIYNNLKPYILDDTGDDLETSENRALIHIQFRLGDFNKTLADYRRPCPEVGRVHDQNVVFTEVIVTIAAADSDAEARCRVFFVNGTGGSGKFLYNCHMHSLRADSKIICPVAWTGIASILLSGDSTSHALFKLPVPLLRKCSIIIWDEAPMAPKEALHCVDRLLRDVTKNDRIKFGGKVLLLGGDFRQQLCLKTNMRVKHGQEEFQQFSFTSARGTCPPIPCLPEDYVELPDFLVLPENVDICSHVFGHEVLTEELVTVWGFSDCHIGIYPVFSHGQLYVALSRAKSFDSVLVLAKQSLPSSCQYAILPIIDPWMLASPILAQPHLHRPLQWHTIRRRHCLKIPQRLICVLANNMWMGPWHRSHFFFFMCVLTSLQYCNTTHPLKTPYTELLNVHLQTNTYISLTHHTSPVMQPAFTFQVDVAGPKPGKMQSEVIEMRHEMHCFTPQRG